MRNPKDTNELPHEKAHIALEIIQYIPNSIVCKTIIHKNTGNITVTSFDSDTNLAEKTSPFDKYILLIDGTAEITINERKHTLKSGEGIIIPSHARHHYQAHKQFKMISTIIKSGYEE